MTTPERFRPYAENLRFACPRIRPVRIFFSIAIQPENLGPMDYQNHAEREATSARTGHQSIPFTGTKTEVRAERAP